MKKKVFSLVLAMMILLCACGTNPKKQREDYSIAVKEDTYVQNGSSTGDTSNLSFSTEETLQIKSNTGSTLRRYTYLKFDVTSLKGDNDFSCIELGITIASKQNGQGNPVTVNLYGCNSNWNETTITYNNQPTTYSLIDTNSNLTHKDVLYEFSVTDYIRQNVKNGYKTVTFMLEEATSPSPMQIQLYSKEGNPEKAPTLFVSYSKVDNKTYSAHEFEFLPTGLDSIVGNQTLTKSSITAYEDTFVSGGEDNLDDAINTNFGNADYLDFKAQIGSYTTKLNRIVLLKFNISNLSLTNFKRVLLQLYCTSSEANEGTDVYVYSCSPYSWNENDVTYATRPTKGELVASAKNVGKGTVFINITNYLQQCVKSGQSIVSLYLEGDATNAKRLQFASTESTVKTEIPPTLVFYKENNSFTTNLTYTTINPWQFAMKLVNEWTTRWQGIQASVGATSAETITKYDEEYAHIVGASSTANGDNTVYKDYKTRILPSLINYTYNENESNLYDKYGGYTGGVKNTGTGYFRTKFINGRWWLIDPLGYPYYGTGVSNLDTGSSSQEALITENYGSVEAWANSTTNRLYELGFNSATGDTDTLLSTDQPLSLIKGFSFLSSYGTKLGLNNSISGSTTFVGGVMPVFDPEFVNHCDSRVKKQIGTYATNPNIIGWTSDNELPADLRMLDNFLSCDPSLSTSSYSYATAWTFMYVMTGKTDVSLEDVTNEHRLLFKAMVYDRYYKVVTSAIETYDTNHMFMGCRYLSGNFNDEYVMKVSGYWCDVITINYYHVWTPNSTLITNIQKWTNTPFLVTEAYAKGMDACTEESGLANTSGAGWTCRTQTDRGMFYQNFSLQLLESKYCVGYNWFRYWDNDPTDTSTNLSDKDANKGLVNNNHEEYEELINYMEELNLNKYSLIKYFDER